MSKEIQFTFIDVNGNKSEAVISNGNLVLRGAAISISQLDELASLTDLGDFSQSIHNIMFNLLQIVSEAAANTWDISDFAPSPADCFNLKVLADAFEKLEVKNAW